MNENNGSRSRNSNKIVLISAIASGAVVGFIHAWTLSDDGIYVYRFIRLMLLAICSYFIVALLARRRGKGITRLPIWLIVAIGGSALTFISINIVQDVEYIWKFRDSKVIGYASGAIQERFIDFILSTIIDCLIAISIMGISHFVYRKVLMVRHLGFRTDRLR